LLCGINAARLARGEETLTLSRDTMLGALCHYIAHAPADGYQPTNATFGLLPEAPRSIRRKRERRLARSQRALESLDAWIAEHVAPSVAPVPPA
jgi:methylenetetrahydrofolate--tRNA-(uracil-5-)-methyltransferase